MDKKAEYPTSTHVVWKSALQISKILYESSYVCVYKYSTEENAEWQKRYS